MVLLGPDAPDGPVCEQCRVPTVLIRSDPPDAAGRVRQHFHCSSCGRSTSRMVETDERGST